MFWVLLLAGSVWSSPLIPNYNAQNCVPGQSWVDNYIKYTCYQRGNQKGFEVVGCAPSNDLVGQVLEPFQTYTTCNFKYVCEMDENYAAYKIKACMDKTGSLLKVGHSRSFDDGESISCLEENGRIRAKIVSKVGCSSDGQIYGEGQTWLQRNDKNGTQEMSSGTHFQCMKYENGTFYRKVQACLTSENRYIRPGEFGTVGGLIVKCVASLDLSEVTATVTVVNKKEVSCNVNNVIRMHNEEWTDSSKNIGYICQFGEIKKRSCIVSGEHILIYSTKYINGKPYYCHQGEGLFTFGNAVGCKTTGGNIVQFDKTFYENDRIMKCSFNFTAWDKAQPDYKQVGCLFRGEEIPINAMQVVDKQYIYCAKDGWVYKARTLTAAEIQQWMKQGGEAFSRTLDGVEGSGNGNFYTQTTTAPPTRPPTTPTTTTTKKPPTTRTPTTTRAPTTTAKPTTTLPPPIELKECQNLVSTDICKQLSPLCQNTEVKAKELKDLISNSKLTKEKQEQAMKLLELFGIANYQKSSSSSRRDSFFSIGGLSENTGGCCGSCCSECNQCRKKQILASDIVKFLCPLQCGCPDGYNKEALITDLLNLSKSCDA